MYNKKPNYMYKFIFNFFFVIKILILIMQILFKDFNKFPCI